MLNLLPFAGLFLRVSRDLLAASYVANGTSYTTNSAVYTTELRNNDTSAAFYFMRQNDSTSQGTETTQLNVKTSNKPTAALVRIGTTAARGAERGM